MEEYNRLRRLLTTWLLGSGYCEEEARKIADSLIELKKAEIARKRLNRGFFERVVEDCAIRLGNVITI